MPYADSNFFLALLKKDDWLKGKAEKLLNEHRGDIWTSQWTVVELLLIAERFGIDTERLVADIFEMASVKDANSEDMVAVAHLMKKYKVNVFDSLHAVFCRNDKIISSDAIFDSLGLERIKLER